MTVHHIVVATDGSDNARHAVAWTAELAAQTGARVTAVHVFEPLAHLAGSGPVDLARLRDEARRELDDVWAAPLRDAGVDVAVAIVEGRAAEAIAGAADSEGADLIVVGARGLSPLRRVVLGSVSQRLPHITTVPVVVVHLPDSQDR